MLNPVKTIKTNAIGTINMLGNKLIPILTLENCQNSNWLLFSLGLARRVNAKILIASTSEIYGDPGIIHLGFFLFYPFN